MKAAWLGPALIGICGWAATPGVCAAEQSTTLSGQLKGTLENKGRPYVVDAGIWVAPGDNLTIAPGVVLLFSEFTGLQVYGTLIAEGTPQAPIVFTSDNDTLHVGGTVAKPPAPYDWDGITISKSASGSSLAFCKIRYSLYGINSLTRYVSLDSVEFARNGKSDFTIEGERQDVGKVPYSYSLLPPELKQRVDTTVVVDTVIQVQAPEEKRSPTLAVFSGTFLLGGLAAGILETVRFAESNQEYNELNDINSDNLKTSGIAEDWDAARTQRNKDLAGLITGYAIGALGAIGLVISF